MTRTMQMTLAMVFLTMLTSTATAQSSKPPTPPKASSPAARITPEAGPADDPDQQATKQDLQKMRVILNQMRTNLAFVGSTTTPLNHQFELDIEMWQMLLDRMERRIGRSGGDQAPKL